MVAPLVAAALPSAKSAATTALKNDFITIKGQTNPKGKGKKKKAPLDYEIHINPTSLAVGGAAILAAGAAAMYVSGMSVGRADGSAKIRTVRAATTATADRPARWIVYTERGRPLRETDGPTPTEADILSINERAQGWKVSKFEKTGDYYTATIFNDRRRHFEIRDRKTGTTDGLDQGLQAVSPVYRFLRGGF